MAVAHEGMREAQVESCGGVLQGDWEWYAEGAKRRAWACAMALSGYAACGGGAGLGVSWHAVVALDIRNE